MPTVPNLENPNLENPKNPKNLKNPYTPLLRDLPEPPSNLWRIIGPGIVAAGVGVFSSITCV